MTELEKYRTEERKRLIYGIRVESNFDNGDDEGEGGFTWRKGFAPPGG